MTKNYWAKLETVQMFISKRIGKPIVYLHTMAHYWATKKDDYYYTEQQGLISKTLYWREKKPDTNRTHCAIHLFDDQELAKPNLWIIEIRNRILSGGWEGVWWWWELAVKEHKIIFWCKEIFLPCLRIVTIAKTYWLENLRSIHNENTKLSHLSKMGDWTSEFACF